jgi:choline dehydrogenase-like flavoprotein
MPDLILKLTGTERSGVRDERARQRARALPAPKGQVNSGSALYKATDGWFDRPDPPRAERLKRSTSTILSWEDL